MPTTWPAYVELLESGELARRAREAVAALADCAACPRQCHADRRRDESPGSYCRGGRLAIVTSAFAHHGEEECLRGWNGSGTIFFSRCSLRCLFCQNFDISWEGRGRAVTAEQLAGLMLQLQEQRCQNINLVTPSHVVPQILEALVLAAAGGLRLPLVYNTGGYDRPETLDWLDGIVDIYMPDLKFWSRQTAQELANAPDYPDVARAAIKEMHRQVGDLVLDKRGLARRGLLVRHLVMPGGLEETRQILRFLAQEVSPDTFVNVMPQYRPEGLARRHAAIARRLQGSEFQQALAIAREEGLRRLAQG
jgi:putative pyruvate formate lyase activating enzyme